MYGLDHAVTLAIVLPGVLRVMKDYKKDKLLHFAQNVWNLNPEYPDEAIDKAIILTEEFFNSLGVKTKLSDYGIGEYGIDQICIRLDRKNYTRLGENKNISPDIVKQILLTVI
jgi:NADP-dependent alcohol dehydrogenase